MVPNRGAGPAWARARAKRQKGRVLLDPPEVQRTAVEAAASRAAPNADHRCVNQLVLENREHGPALILVESAERVVQHDPAGAMQQEAREGQALLFLEGQILVPPLLTIECSQQMMQPDPLERGGDGGAVEAPGRRGIARPSAQAAKGQLRPRRHEHRGVARGQVDDASAPRPQAAMARNSTLRS